MPTFGYLWLAATFALPQAWAADAPAGKGRETFLQVCTACHGAEVAMEQRNSRAGWTTVVQAMKDMGAEGTPAQFNEVISYLSEHFAGPASTASGAKGAKAGEKDRPPVRRALPWEKNSLSAGQALYRENCVVCHDIEGLQGKKLGPSFQGLFRKEMMPLTTNRPTRAYISAKVRAGGKLMPSFANRLSGDEITALLDYMQSK